MNCFFNSLTYQEGLSNIGEAVADSLGRFHLIKRSIPGTDLFDGYGGVPYVWMDSAFQIEEWANAFPDLVTITLITQPGFEPIGSGHPYAFLKNHFVHDPSLPRTQLSPRSEKKLLKSKEIAAFSLVNDFQTKMKILPLYRLLQVSRDMYSPFENHSDTHFEQLAKDEAGVFFQVTSDSQIGSMACGVRFGDCLQLLHTVNSQEGLHWNSSYLLMSGILDYCEAEGIKLFTGGLPQRHTPGLEIFKSRWSNCQLPVYFSKIINRPEEYKKLCNGFTEESDYFPRYRWIR